MARRINAPGIEVNEIDRSQYGGNVDNSTVGTATLVLGFGDKGDDYNVKWINNMDTFVNNYGNPTNDAERYFYNAVYEVVNGGGVCYTAKLPYYNDSVGNFVYTSYTVDSTATQISSPVSIVSSIYIPEFDLEDLLFFPQDITCDVPGLTSTTLCALVNDESLDFELPAVNSFVAYVKSAANFQVDNQQYLDKHLSTSLGRRTATALFHEILDFTSPDYADPEVSAFVNGCRQSLVDAFGDDITIEGMVERYMGLLYLHEFKEFLSDSINALSIDNPFGELTSLLNTEYTDFAVVDDSLTSYATISADISSKNEIMSYENYDKFIIKELPVPKNKIYIVDQTRGKYGKDVFGNEVVGIVPVIVTPANALFYQEIIHKTDAILSDYNVISKLRNSFRKALGGTFDETVEPFDETDTVLSDYSGKSRQFIGLGDYLGAEVFSDGTRVTVNDYTVSQYAADHFPTIRFVGGRLERRYLGQIGVVVFKAFKDSANENRISLSPVESFVGSLDRTAVDEYTGQKTFIDDIVNTNSNYINLFSNADIPENDDKRPLGLKNTSIYAIKNQTACSMGFYERDTRKNIHVTESIYKPMLKIFEKGEDKNTLDIDILLDGGVSNIAQFIASTQLYARKSSTDDTTAEFIKDEFQRYGRFDFSSESAYLFRLDTHNQCNVWRKVLQRFDEFAKNTRKDCIFIADGPRPFCIEGNSKIIRRSKPENTVQNSILPKMKFVSGVVNSSYSAGYLDWFWSLDHSTGDFFWCPPSIKALGVYLYTDNRGAYWDAPAGLNRGHVSDTLDIAFNPTNDEAGQIYVNSWNYSVSYPLDGIVIEGQRTFQREKTALDRVNVRRLMLGLEKTIRGFCKYYVYEGNTSYTRGRLKDTIDRYLEQVSANDGISQYITICDDRNNTPQTIDNNELHITVGVRPVKSIEFIVLNLIATNQSVDVTEAVVQNI